LTLMTSMNYLFLLLPVVSIAGCVFLVWLILRIGLARLKAGNKTGNSAIPESLRLKIADAAVIWFSPDGDNSSKLVSGLSDPALFERVRPVIEEQMDDFLRNRLKEQMPMIGMFIGDKTIETLKPIFIGEIQRMFPLVTSQIAGGITNNLDVRKIVSAELEKVSHSQLQDFISPIIRPAVSKAYIMAFLTGLMISIVQLMFVYLLP
jgi:hypothetical protein